MASKNVAAAKPVDVYVRVSRVNGREVEADGQTAAEQERKCRAQAELDGRTVGEVFTDLNISGAKSSRPALDAMLARIESGESGGVYSLNLSRFTRKADPVPDIMRIEQAGAVFVSLEEKLDLSTAMGRALARILGVINALKVEQAGDQFAGNVAQAAARGIYVGRAPFGFLKDEERRLHKIEETCEVIVRAYRRRVGGGSWLEVARILSETGKVFSVTAARNLLDGRIYMGFLPNGKKGEGTFCERIVVVPPSVWEAANAKHEGGRKPGRKDGGGSPLAKLLKCGCCGRSLGYRQDKRGERLHRYYRCTSGSTYCSHPTNVRADDAEAVVLDMLFDGHFESWTHGSEPDAKKVAVLEIERDDAASYVRELDAAITGGARISPAALEAAQARLDAAQAALEDEVGVAPETLSEQDMRAAFEAASVEDRRAMIRRFLGTITVTAEGTFVPASAQFAAVAEEVAA